MPGQAPAHKELILKSVKRFDLYMSGNDMRNVELPIILTSLTLDYGCWIPEKDGRRIASMELDCSVDLSNQLDNHDVCIIKRVK